MCNQQNLPSKVIWVHVSDVNHIFVTFLKLSFYFQTQQFELSHTLATNTASAVTSFTHKLQTGLIIANHAHTSVNNLGPSADLAVSTYSLLKRTKLKVCQLKSKLLLLKGIDFGVFFPLCLKLV